MDEKARPKSMLFIKSTLYQDTDGPHIIEWKEACHANCEQRKIGVGRLVSSGSGFKTKSITRNNEVHLLMITVFVCWEELTVVKMYVP